MHKCEVCQNMTGPQKTQGEQFRGHTDAQWWVQAQVTESARRGLTQTTDGSPAPQEVQG